MKPKLLFLVSIDTYFYTHRLTLGLAAAAAGYEVAVACRTDKHHPVISEAGIQVFPLKYLTRSGLNPLHQLLALLELRKLYQYYKPDIVHHVAMKPVILGTFIAKLSKIPKVINAFGGLGYLFTDASHNEMLDTNDKIRTLFKILKKRFIRILFPKICQYLFSDPRVLLILQNQDDINTLIHHHCIMPNWTTHKKVILIPGVGINTLAFPEVPPPPVALNGESPIRIACVSRMLRDKGILDLIHAAKILHAKGICIRVILYGDVDPENPASLKASEIQYWHNLGIIEWHGYCETIVKAYQTCHIAVLPSYREGFPKSLLEAASTGRPIVATDVPGCREIVQHNRNGLLVPAKNPEALANALETLCQNEALRIKMGQESRKLVEKHFLASNIHQQILTLYKN